MVLLGNVSSSPFLSNCSKLFTTTAKGMIDPENEESGFVEQSERLDSERLDSGLPTSIAGQL